MKKRIIPILVISALVLSSCSVFSKGSTTKPLTDAEMATRVAELLSTMTTPTSEIVFPPTSTPEIALPTVASTTSLDSIIVIETQEPTVTSEPVEVTETQPPVEETEVPVQPTVNIQYPDSDPVRSLGTPSSIDTMDNATTWTWPTGSDDFTDIQFADGYMKLTNINAKLAGWRLPLVSQQVDAYIELTANSGSCSGKDSYGVIFRVPVFRDADQGYIFQATCDGYYRLWKWDGKTGDNGTAVSLIPWKESSAIQAGSDQVNRLGIMNRGDNITLYVNGIALGTVTDASYKAGFFGVFVRSGSSTNYTARIDSMSFWENPGQ